LTKDSQSRLRHPLPSSALLMGGDDDSYEHDPTPLILINFLCSCVLWMSFDVDGMDAIDNGGCCRNLIAISMDWLFVYYRGVLWCHQ
jgi:hypothetical protein